MESIGWQPPDRKAKEEEKGNQAGTLKQRQSTASKGFQHSATTEAAGREWRKSDRDKGQRKAKSWLECEMT